MSQGFVLENVHWSPHWPHQLVLCFDSSSPAVDPASPVLYCFNCVNYALNSVYELAVSKRELLATSIEIIVANFEVFRSVDSHYEALSELFAFAARESNFVGYPSVAQVREALLSLFCRCEPCSLLGQVLLSRCVLLLQQHPLSDLSWMLSVLNHLAQHIKHFEGDVALLQLFDANDRLIGHLSHAISHDLRDTDKSTLLRLMCLVEYRPPEQELDKVCFGLFQTLERPVCSTALQYHALLYATCIIPHVNTISLKYLHTVNRLVLHEDKHVATAAFALLSVLLRLESPAVSETIQLSNSLDFAVESILSSNGDIAEESEAMEGFVDAALDALVLLLHAQSAPLPLHMADLIPTLFTIAKTLDHCAEVALKVVAELVAAPSTLHRLPTDTLLHNLMEAIPENSNQPVMAGELLNLARAVAPILDDKSLLALANVVHSALDALFQVIEVELDTNHAMANGTGGSVPCSVFLTLLGFESTLIDLLPHCVVRPLEDYFIPVTLQYLPAIIGQPEVSEGALGLISKIVGSPALVPSLCRFLQHGLLSILFQMDDYNHRHHLVTESLVELLKTSLGDSHLAEWRSAFPLLHPDPQGLTLGVNEQRTLPSIGNQGISLRAGLAGIASADFVSLTTLIDLLYLALLFGDVNAILYLVDEAGMQSTYPHPEDWKHTVRVATGRAANAFRESANLFLLSHTIGTGYRRTLCQLCCIWSHCYDARHNQSDFDSLTNQRLVQLLGSVDDLSLALLAPTLEKAPCFPLPLAAFDWIFQHLHQGLILPALNLVRELLDKAEEETGQLILRHLAGGSPTFLRLLVDSYISNSVCDPIISPLQALAGLVKLLCSGANSCTVSPRLDLSSPSTSTPTTSQYLDSPFALQLNMSCARALLELQFPVACPPPDLPLTALQHHAQVVLYLLVCEVSRMPSPSPSTEATPSALFARYWKALTALTSSCLHAAQTPHVAKYAHWKQVDMVLVELMNIWNTLLYLKPPVALVARLVSSSSTLKRLWSACRTPSPSSPTALVTTELLDPSFQEDIGELEAKLRWAAQGHSTKPKNKSHAPWPPPLSSLSTATNLSVHLLSRLEAPNDSAKRPPGCTLASQLLSLLSQASHMNIPSLHRLILVNNMTSLAHRLHSTQEQGKVGALEGTISLAERNLAFLGLASVAATLLLFEDSLLGQSCSWLLASIMAEASGQVATSYLKMPQVLFLLRRLLKVSCLSSPLSCTDSMFTTSVVIAVSRTSPCDIGLPVLRLLLSQRFVRKVLISCVGEPVVSQINLLTLYHLLRCGLWHTITHPSRATGRLLVKAARVNLHKLTALAAPSATPRPSSCRYLQMDGVLLFDNALEPPLEHLSGPRETRAMIEMMASWLSIDPVS